MVFRRARADTYAGTYNNGGSLIAYGKSFWGWNFDDGVGSSSVADGAAGRQ